MGATFIITLREAFEAALLLGIVYTYLDKVGARRHFRWVTLGAALGAAASVAVGAAVSLASGPLVDLGPDLVGVAVLLVAVVVLTWHGWWMRQHSLAIKGQVQRRLDEAEATNRMWVVGAIAFTGVFREGAETVLFLWGLMSQAGVAGWGGAIGGATGVATAAALGWAIFRGGRRVSLPRFFAVTSLLVILVAGGLFSTGVGKVEALGFLPASPGLWDSSWLLSDQGVTGGFLAGLVGYRARPTLFEVIAYAGYLGAAGWLFFGRRRPDRSLARQSVGTIARGPDNRFTDCQFVERPDREPIESFTDSQRSSIQPSVAPR
jgi:high-affinity iron transporter